MEGKKQPKTNTKTVILGGNVKFWEIKHIPFKPICTQDWIIYPRFKNCCFVSGDKQLECHNCPSLCLVFPVIPKYAKSIDEVRHGENIALVCISG